MRLPEFIPDPAAHGSRRVPKDPRPRTQSRLWSRPEAPRPLLRCEIPKLKLILCSLTLDQVDACDPLASFVSDCDRKTEQAKKKLAETQEALSDEVRAGQYYHHHHHHHRHHHKQGPTCLVVQVTGKANSVHDFAEQIGKKLAAAELLGAEGDVEGSIKLMEEVTRWYF